MEITVDTAGQEDRMCAQLAMNPTYTRGGSVFNVGDPVIVVDLTEDVDGSPSLMGRKGGVVEIDNDDPLSVRVVFAGASCPMWFKDCELAIDAVALLEADEAARREYVA